MLFIDFFRTICYPKTIRISKKADLNVLSIAVSDPQKLIIMVKKRNKNFFIMFYCLDAVYKQNTSQKIAKSRLHCIIVK